MKTIRHVFDTVAAFIAGGALLQILPALAALISIVWYALQIYSWFKNRRSKQ